MTDEQRQQLKAQLIKAGFWGADEPGDPTTELIAVSQLLDRIEEKLDAVLIIAGGVGATDSFFTPRAVSVLGGKHSIELASGETYFEAICLAAVALPAFLKRHPGLAISTAVAGR